MSHIMPVRTYIAYTEPLMNKECFEKYLEQVSAERREKVQKYRFQEDQARSLAAGLVMNYALRDLGLDPSEICLTYGKNGKPEIPGNTGIFFNLSHSGDRAMCVVGSRKVGCDVEKLRETKGMQRIADHYFARQEQEQLAACISEEERQACFFRIWTRKESFLKCRGTGLSESLRSFSVDLNSFFVEEAGTKYYFQEYDMEDTYRYSVCSTGNEFEKQPRMVTFLQNGRKY